MAKPALIAKITAKDGKRDELAAVFSRVLESVRANEPGTEVYVMHDDAKDPNVVWFYELYTDDAALATHGSSDIMKAVGPDLAPLMAGRPELTRLVPRAGKGVSL